jgi:hypothetical protein
MYSPLTSELTFSFSFLHISDGISGFIHLPNEDTEIVYKDVHNSIEESCVL